MEQALGDRAAGLLRELKQAGGGSELSLPPYNVSNRRKAYWVFVSRYGQQCIGFKLMSWRLGGLELQFSGLSTLFENSSLRRQEAQLKKVIQEIHWLYEQNNATIE